MTIFTRKLTSLAGMLAMVLLLLSGCSGKSDLPEAEASAAPPPQDFSVNICENVFDAFRSGEIPEAEIRYLDKEKDIALRDTDIIINQGDSSRFWVMTSLKDLLPGQNYNFRYELINGSGRIFRSESFTFAPDSPEYRSFIIEELNPQGRKKLSAGLWTVKVHLNNTLLATKTVSILSSKPGQDVAFKEYKWKEFQFQYPGYCTIEEDRDIITEEGKPFRLVKLTVSSKNRIGVFLYLDDNWVPPTEVIAQQSPAMANMMLGLPIALKQAEPAGAEAIALSAGSIELADGFSLATRFLIHKPGEDSFSSLECFHRAVANNMFFGILYTQGLMGKGSDTPEYFRFIQDSYAIIRSISMPGLVVNAEEQKP